MNIFRFLLLTILVGSSCGAPTEKAPSSFVRPFVTKEKFEHIVKSIQSSLTKTPNTIFPKEISDFVMNITTADYDAFKYLHGKIMNSDITERNTYQMVMTFKKEYPSLSSRVETAALSLFRRIRNLSNSTKRLTANVAQEN
uniref:DUF4296 domain-containing protein n=1 Tax=Steinernema glaseri TaxID=37863 RepID=A0A1I7YFR0_9BILA